MSRVWRRLGAVLAVSIFLVALGARVVAPAGASPRLRARGASAVAIETSFSGVYPGANWYGPDDTGGYRQIDRTVVPELVSPDLFMSTEWWFGSSGVTGYEGIQTGEGPNGGLGMFSVWNAVDAQPAPGATCAPFTGEGDGLHCFAPLPVVPGHAYLTHVAIDQAAGANEWLHGTIVDVTTGVTYDLGRIEAPTDQPLTAPADFMEYYGGDKSALTCDQYPYSIADFGTPALTLVDGRTAPATLGDPSPASCGETGTMTITPDGVRVEFGGPEPYRVANLTATPGNGDSLNLSWVSPVSDGGSPILGTTVETSTDQGATWTTTVTVPAGQTTTTLENLDPNTNAVRVAAVNAAGTGAYSPVVGFALLSMPPVVSATAGDGNATLNWRAPLSNGGSPITGYVVTPYRNGVAQAPRATSSPATTTTINGLRNGGAYTFTVAAVNAGVTGPQSSPTPAIIVGTPAAPTGTHPVRVATGQFKVNFAPGNNNGAKTTSYTATCTSPNGGVTQTRSGSRSPVTVGGLTPAKSYTCTVTAANSRGRGSASSPSPLTTA